MAVTRSLILAAIVMAIIIFIGINTIGFYGNFGDDVIEIKNLIWYGINLIFSLFIAVASIQIFGFWLFVDQVGKLKNLTDEFNDELNVLNEAIEKIKSDVELLL